MQPLDDPLGILVHDLQRLLLRAINEPIHPLLVSLIIFRSAERQLREDPMHREDLRRPPTGSLATCRRSCKTA
jgi:hypothetical protein